MPLHIDDSDIAAVVGEWALGLPEQEDREMVGFLLGLLEDRAHAMERMSAIVEDVMETMEAIT